MALAIDHSVESELASAYANACNPEVSSLLANSLRVVSVLRELPNVLSEYFPECALSLKATCDPEHVDPPQLLVCVHTSLSPLDALARLQQFDHSWWLANADAVADQLVVDVAPA